MHNNNEQGQVHSESQASRRIQGVNPMLILRFIATSFAYLLAGLVIFLFNMLLNLNLQRDAIFVLWLFGFVAMIIFGLSYMFSSGLSRSSVLINSTIKKEYVLLNFGVVTFFTGFSGALPLAYGKPFALAGLLAIIISVSLHLMNLILAATARKSASAEKRAYQDNY